MANNLNVDELKKSIIGMQKALDNFTSALGKKTKVQKDNTKGMKDAIEANEKLTQVADKRTKVISKTIDALKEEGKALNVLSFDIQQMKDNFRLFEKQGGNIFDYLDMAITSTREEVKLFGQDAAVSRKIMYGFLPPGAFRLINKASTGLRLLGGIFRGMKDDTEKMPNIFTNMIKALGKMSGLGYIKEMRNRAAGDLKGVARIDEEAQASFGFTKKQATSRKRLATRAATYTKRGGFARLGILADMFDKGGALSLRKGDMAKRRGKSPLENLKGKLSKAYDLIKVIASVALAYKKKALAAVAKMAVMSARFFILFMLYASLAFIILKPIMPMIKEAFNWAINTLGFALSQLWEGLGFILEGIGMVFNAIFGDGTVFDLLNGFYTIFIGVVKVLWGILVGLIAPLPAFLLGLAWGAIKQLGKWFMNLISGTKNTAKAIIQLVIFAGLIYAFAVGFPLILAGAIAVGVYALSKKIFGFSEGGTTRSPVSLVGEKGPELVRLPTGSRVTSNKNTVKQLNSSPSTNNINITINARDTSDSEMRRIADKIANIVNNKVGRSVSQSNTF